MGSLPPWSLIQELVLRLVLPAGAVAAAVLAATCALTKSQVVRMAGAALAVVAGLAAGNHFRDLLEWWPRDPGPEGAVDHAAWWALARGWPALLPVAATAMAVAAAGAVAARRGWYWGVAARLVAAAGAAVLLAEPLPPLSKTSTLALLIAGMALSHEALVLATRRTPSWVPLFALALPWGAAAATVLIFAHSARFSDLGTLLTASLCGAGLIAVVWKVDPTAILAGPSTILPPLLLAGAANTFSEVPTAAFVVAAFAPCALWLLLVPPLRRLPPRRLAAAAIAAVLIPCAAAGALAAWFETLEFGE